MKVDEQPSPSWHATGTVEAVLDARADNTREGAAQLRDIEEDGAARGHLVTLVPGGYEEESAGWNEYS